MGLGAHSITGGPLSVQFTPPRDLNSSIEETEEIATIRHDARIQQIFNTITAAKTLRPPSLIHKISKEYSISSYTRPKII